MTRHLLAIAALLIFSQFHAIAQAPKGHALIIATRKVDEKTVAVQVTGNPNEDITYGPLDFVDNDVRKIKYILQMSGFKEGDIINLTKDKLTLKEVRDAFKTLKSRVGPNDLVMVYFTGHGDQIPDKDKVEPDSLDEVLVLYDGILIDDEINKLMKGFPLTARKLLIVDACHSGSSNKMVATHREMLGQMSNKSFRDERTSNKITLNGQSCTYFTSKSTDNTEQNIVYFGACGDNQESKANSEGSYFTTAIYSRFYPFNLSVNYTYVSFFCAVKDVMKSISQTQTIHYEETNKAPYSLTDHFLKIKQ